MRVAVFGLGYAGVVTAAGLASTGCDVIGVDIQPDKVALINAGCSPIHEHGLDELVQDTVRRDSLSATTDVSKAIRKSELSFICVGTPSNTDGSIDLSHVKNVTKQIAESLTKRKNRDQPHLIVFRSTMLPGTTENILLPILRDVTGEDEGELYRVAYNPEFMREGKSVADFLHPARNVLGTNDEESLERLIMLWDDVSYKSNWPIPTVVDIPTAEFIKYASNAFNALKISFVNEMGTIAKHYGVDGSWWLDTLQNEGKMNMANSYLRPGFAFGGSCLPKDLRALVAGAKAQDCEVPLLKSIMRSNDSHLERATALVQETISDKSSPQIAILGLAFKAGTDDTRESPAVILASQLIADDIKIKIFDPTIELDELIGANKDYLYSELPTIDELLAKNIGTAIEGSDAIIIANANQSFIDVRKLAGDIPVIDLVGLFDTISAKPANLIELL